MRVGKRERVALQGKKAVKLAVLARQDRVSLDPVRTSMIRHNPIGGGKRDWSWNGYTDRKVARNKRIITE